MNVVFFFFNKKINLGVLKCIIKEKNRKKMSNTMHLRLKKGNAESVKCKSYRRKMKNKNQRKNMKKNNV